MNAKIIGIALVVVAAIGAFAGLSFFGVHSSNVTTPPPTPTQNSCPQPNYLPQLTVTETSQNSTQLTFTANYAGGACVDYVWINENNNMIARQPVSITVTGTTVVNLTWNVTFVSGHAYQVEFSTTHGSTSGS